MRVISYVAALLVLSGVAGVVGTRAAVLTPQSAKLDGRDGRLDAPVPGTPPRPPLGKGGKEGGEGALSLEGGEDARPPEAVRAPEGVCPPEVISDWELQDGVVGHRPGAGAILKAAAELGAMGGGEAAGLRGGADNLRRGLDDLRRELDGLRQAPADDPRWTELYVRACTARRAVRLRTLLAKAPRIIFTKHGDMGGTQYAYTEGQSDAQNERNFTPGAKLGLLTFDGLYGRVETLLEDAGGVIRDPDVSCDARRLLFAWKKSLDGDDFHLYEMDMKTRKIRQITSGLGFADYEGVWAPNGDIIFNSTRCVQTVDCWWTEVSNLYTCDCDGRYMRRLTFDQVHTNYPTMTPDGRVLYTRWEYNDRSQIWPHGLFQMSPDGTGQTEVYGNDSWFPTSIIHARAIPGTSKFVGVFTGHHVIQKGWLGIIDPTRGRQESAGAQLIAPVRKTEAVHADGYAQDGDQFQYPYPLSETEFIVTFKPAGSEAPFALYWMDAAGRRELLASDSAISCNQPMPLMPRPAPHVRPSEVDYREKEGVYYMQDIYAGPGVAGVSRGTIKKLRVVALDFRAAGVGANGNTGEGGFALVSTPVAVGNGTWDPKTVLGEATVYEDGSAMFAVPARRPVYFQAINEKGYAVQTMRSWSTLEPGERLGCVGCHEEKNAAPLAYKETPLAMEKGVERLAGFYGPARGFSFPREIQPILDRHCVRCHEEPLPAGWADRESDDRGFAKSGEGEKSFSLLGREVIDASAKRRWSESYLALTNSRLQGIETGERTFFGRADELVNWLNPQSAPTMLRPASVGAVSSRLMKLLEEGHRGVMLSREELEKFACWIDLLVPYCGDYFEANAWRDEDMRKYRGFLGKRQRMEEMERRNVEGLPQVDR
jgi:hypothetical protein